MQAGGPGDRGYLLLADSALAQPGLPPWRGQTKHIKLTAETIIALTQVRVTGLLLVAPSSGSLETRRKEFLRQMRDCVVLGREQRAASQAIAHSLGQVKNEALQLRSQICCELAMVEEKCDSSGLEPYDKEALSRRMREILHLCYKFGFEFHRDLDKLTTGRSSRAELATGTINFSQQWMRFVLAWCDKGRGLKPDWATKGIEFLHFAANPEITKYLTDQQFLEFKSLTEACHSHVVGDKDERRRDSVSPGVSNGYSRGGSRHASPSRSLSREDSALRSVCSPGSQDQDQDRAAMPPPQSPVTSLPRRRRKGPRKSLTTDELDMTGKLTIRVPPGAGLPWRERVRQSVARLEEGIEESRRDLLVVGQVLDTTQHEDRFHIKARQVRFSWQRGVKIGQGNFGKVYTAINNQSGDIMAMKEIPLQPNDHKTLRNVADELRIFESVQHPHLVRHFGVEIHR